MKIFILCIHSLSIHTHFVLFISVTVIDLAAYAGGKRYCTVLCGDYCDKCYYLTWLAIPPKCPSVNVFMKVGSNIIKPGKNPIHGRNLQMIASKGTVR